MFYLFNTVTEWNYRQVNLWSVHCMNFRSTKLSRFVTFVHQEDVTLSSNCNRQKIINPNILNIYKNIWKSYFWHPIKSWVNILWSIIDTTYNFCNNLQIQLLEHKNIPTNLIWSSPTQQIFKQLLWMELLLNNIYVVIYNLSVSTFIINPQMHNF